ncbi:MAG: hypothetical protein M3O15_06955 [Acidobacteriota bacterium]|nr:hypothetical protein [Acidobacteriota bacterium]
MKKKSPSGKLVVTRETLVRLNDALLGLERGGADTEVGGSCCPVCDTGTSPL